MTMKRGGCCHGITKMYLVIWCLHLLQPWADMTLFGMGSGGLDLRPLVAADSHYLLPAVVATLLLLLLDGSEYSTLQIPLALASHLIDLLIRYDRLPAVWDHEIWGVLVNFSFFVCYAFVGDNRELWFLPLARLQLGIFYAAATFWKFNSSFLDPNTSCGTILIVELVGTYSWDANIPGMDMLVQIAPQLTLLVEGLLGYGMLHTGLCGTRGRSTWIRNCTVGLAVLFHLSIFMLPVNSAGGFSLECLTRFILFFDTLELEQIKWMERWSELVTGSILLSSVLVLLRQSATGAPLDVGFVAAVVISYFYICLLVATYHGRKASLEDPSSITTIAKTSRLKLILYGGILFITAFYAFMTPILGIMQQSAPTMYANLRSYRGGNHYWVPTGILGEDVLYGGGLVQVVSSTSWSVNVLLAQIPSDQVFPSRVVESLSSRIRRDNMYEGMPLQLFPYCMHNPHSRQVLLEDYLLSHPYSNTTLATPMILPISTLRAALLEASQHKKSYTVKLSESLERHPSVVLQLSSDGTCLQLVEGIPRGDCRASRIIQMLHQQDQETSSSAAFWKPIVDKLLVPYPELVGLDEEICMS